MSPLRFSVRSLLAAVALVAIGMAAFVSASALWSSLLLFIAVSSLGIALIVALVGRGGPRSFAIGYVVLGTVYLALFLNCWRSDAWRPLLVTSRLIDWAFQFRAVADTHAMYPGAVNAAKLADNRFGYVDLGRGGYTSFAELRTYPSVALSGHSFLVIAFGLAGGALAVYVARGPARHSPA